MKQKTQWFLLLWLMVALWWPVKLMAQVEVGDYTYTFSGSEATIRASSLTTGHIVIPETVVYEGKTYDVTSIFLDKTLFKNLPTIPVYSVTGKSIRSIEGKLDMSRWGVPDINSSIVQYTNNCEFFDFPKLKTLKNCCLSNIDNEVLTSIDFPELETVEGVWGFIYRFNKLTSVSLPKLRKLRAGYSFSYLPILTSISLPELTDIDMQLSFHNLSTFTSIHLPKLRKMYSQFCFELCPLLERITLPEVRSIDGVGVFMRMNKLQTLEVPKLQKLTAMNCLYETALSKLNLPVGCEVKTDYLLCNATPSVESITVTGPKKMVCDHFASSGKMTLKHICLPDVEELKGNILCNSEGVESISMPKLKRLDSVMVCKEGEFKNLTRVDFPNMQELRQSELSFASAPLTTLTLRSDLKVDEDSRLTLDTYPTVVTVNDVGRVNDIPSSFFEDVRGGRFIVPKGKAALFTAKWNLNTGKTMVYSPVDLHKTTDGTLFASGCITTPDASCSYEGKTYINQYDFGHAMTAADCKDPLVLGANDKGFTPAEATLQVKDGENAFSGYNFYYATTYENKEGERMDELTLSAVPFSVNTTALQGFSEKEAQLNNGIGRAFGGFLFKGNTDEVNEVYLPYSPMPAKMPYNFLRVGEGENVTSRTHDSFDFYWHPGSTDFAMGFYESSNVLISEGRAYLSLSTSVTSGAKPFRLKFEDNETTGIRIFGRPANSAHATSLDAWYTLQGIRLGAKPTAAGVYVNGGRKIVIK